MLPRNPKLFAWKADFDITKRANTLFDVLAKKFRKHTLSFKYLGNKKVYMTVAPNILRTQTCDWYGFVSETYIAEWIPTVDYAMTCMSDVHSYVVDDGEYDKYEAHASEKWIWVLGEMEWMKMIHTDMMK